LLLTGEFSGERKEYNPKGFVVEDTGNAVWGMQFIWPFKADYRIVYLDDNYEQTIIGRNARDYVWVMARTPQISDADYSELISVVESLGYELTNLRKSPHEEKNKLVNRKKKRARNTVGLFKFFVNDDAPLRLFEY